MEWSDRVCAFIERDGRHHCIEVEIASRLRRRLFKSSYYADVALNQWLALTPPELVKAHLKLDTQALAALHREKFPVVPT